MNEKNGAGLYWMKEFLNILTGIQVSPKAWVSDIQYPIFSIQISRLETDYPSDSFRSWKFTNLKIEN
jgi:hypothetical protein